MAPAATEVAVHAPSQSPYQFDQPQALKASTALLKHLKTAPAKGAQDSKRNLLAPGDADDDEESEQTAEAIWCVVTTKKHIVDQKRLKPSKIALPHTLNRSSATSICLITPDPQRAFKDVLEQPSFPRALASQIRILGLTKLKQRYKSFESRRQLHAQYDVFLADDRAVTVLPRLLGKIFYESSKRPVPVRLEGHATKDVSGKKVKQAAAEGSKSVLPAAGFAKEIEKTLSSARVHLSASVTTSVQVGWSHFTPEQIADNVQAVVEGMVQKFITKGWRNLRAVHIKGPNSAALPIWMSDTLWVDEDDVLEEEAAAKAKQIGSQKGTKRKGRELEIDDDPQELKKIKSGHDTRPKKEKKQTNEEGFDKDMAARREALRQAKREVREEADQQEANQAKKKSKKSKSGDATSIKSGKAIAAPG